MKTRAALLLFTAAILASDTAFAESYQDAGSANSSSYAAPDSAYGSSSSGSSSASGGPQSSWSAAPTAAGGIAASGTFSDEHQRGYFDFFYTPFGDHMKGGGFSITAEEVNDDPIKAGGRFGGFYVGGSANDYDMSLYGMTLDLYALHQATDELSFYAGIGLFVFMMEMEMPYAGIMRNGDGSSITKQDADGQTAFISAYAGARLRIADTFTIFGEYRYENGDVTLSTEYSGDMDAKDIGGGRFVFGAGFAF